VEVKSLVHQIKSYDSYNVIGKCVPNGQYEKWLSAKKTEFEMTYPDQSKGNIVEAFQIWDLDGSGLIEAYEMRLMLGSSGFTLADSETTIRRWFYSGAFRSVHGANGTLIPRPSTGAMSLTDFEVFVLLNQELEEGDFDEDRLSTWLEMRLDTSGDGMVSVEEFKQNLPEVTKASGLDEPEIRRMFKIISGSDDENLETEAIEVEKIVIWLKKFAVTRRKESIARGGNRPDSLSTSLTRAATSINVMPEILNL